jgi:hypothetical protein
MKDFCIYCGKKSKIVTCTKDGCICKVCNDYKNNTEDWGL